MPSGKVKNERRVAGECAPTRYPKLVFTIMHVPWYFYACFEMSHLWPPLCCPLVSGLSLSLSELKIRQEKGVICSKAAILAVDDPKPGIGSGSATLNALISVTESLAAQEIGRAHV